MSYQRFEIPTVDQLSEFEQLTVEHVGDEPGTLSLQSMTPGGDGIELVVDPLGRSIKLVWLAGGDRILEMFREGATRLTVLADEDLLKFQVSFSGSDIGGSLKISIGSKVFVNDALLFQ